MKRVIVIAALLAVPFAAQAQETPLTPAEIKAAWVGKKVFARGANGSMLDLHMNADGSAAVAVGNFSDTGTWKLSDSGYCATWKRIREGKEACFTVVRRGNTVYILNADKSVNGEVLRIVD
jgi:uncharacterized membrane protein